MNRWLWVHILGGGCFGYLFNQFFTAQISVSCVIGVAFLWEVFEYIKDDVEKIYGSKKRFYLDAIQDIAGAVVMAIIVVI